MNMIGVGEWVNTLYTPSGGSLGSWVDEERSQLRVIVWIAGHIDHWQVERILRLLGT